MDLILRKKVTSQSNAKTLQIEAATKIQSFWRAHHCRVVFKRMVHKQKLKEHIAK